MASIERVTVGFLASTPGVCSELQACLRRLPVHLVIEERASLSPDALTIGFARRFAT